MTDTTHEAPERIWLTRDETYWQNDLGIVFTFQVGSHDIEYVPADRIEELEAKGLANKVAIMRLEAKLAKALEFIQDLTGCEWPYDEDAKRILAELTGGKDA